ncbi:MAG: prepilin-type N-terminal cleavage/methylation domain-containing protein [Kurthia sp.]|nr:prepilin-type N-terminal cleavage/methylation domain-containing protein [Candidatus Kurthia equi]
MKEKGFTLVEMLIVLFIISVLILISIPNVTKHFATVEDKGCDAYIKMAQGQVEAYKIDLGKYPESITELEDGGYLKGESQKRSCKGKEIIISQGEVIVNE